MKMKLDNLDCGILDILQGSFPLEERPFAAMAERLGATEDEVLVRVRALKKSGIVRQVSAIFDSIRLGYQSVLLAFEVPKERIEEAAEILNAHPGVSHNYERDFSFPLWCTLAVPPESDLEAHARALQEQTGASRYLFLPSVKRYKIGVNFRMSADPEDSNGDDSAGDGQSGGEDQAGGKGQPEGAAQAVAAPSPPPVKKSKPTYTDPKKPSKPLDEKARKAVRALQIDIPLVPRPYDELAPVADMTPAEMIEAGRRFLDSGQMRRYAAILRHREAGYTHNVMSVWAVPDDRADEMGAIMSGFQEVSHCYKRPSCDAFPHSHYAMIHARSAEAAQGVVDRIQAATGLEDHRLLHTTREFKKVRVQYFTPDIPEWEKKHGLAPD